MTSPLKCRCARFLAGAEGRAHGLAAAAAVGPPAVGLSGGQADDDRPAGRAWWPYRAEAIGMAVGSLGCTTVAQAEPQIAELHPVPFPGLGQRFRLAAGGVHV